jgi:hypothetical protein
MTKVRNFFSIEEIRVKNTFKYLCFIVCNCKMLFRGMLRNSLQTKISGFGYLLLLWYFEIKA